MAVVKKHRHYSPNQILKYLAGKLKPEEKRTFNRVLRECPTCASLANRARKISDLADDWSLESFQEAHHRARLSKALREASRDPDNRTFLERLRDWSRQIGQQPWAWLDLLNRPATCGIRTVLADLKNLGNPIKPGVVYDYQYAIMKSSSQKRGVAQPSKQNSPSLKTRSPSSHGIVGVASGELRKLVVHLDSAPLKGMLPLVMLVSEGPARPAMIRPLRRTSPTATPSTRFTSVDPGKYLLAVEPLPHRQN